MHAALYPSSLCVLSCSRSCEWDSNLVIFERTLGVEGDGRVEVGVLDREGVDP